MTTSGWREKLKHELRSLIPVTLFFFVTFQLLGRGRVVALFLTDNVQGVRS
jgi:hypothetical protein